jgi:hypothetical protein
MAFLLPNKYGMLFVDAETGIYGTKVRKEEEVLLELAASAEQQTSLVDSSLNSRKRFYN